MSLAQSVNVLPSNREYIPFPGRLAAMMMIMIMMMMVVEVQAMLILEIPIAPQNRHVIIKHGSYHHSVLQSLLCIVMVHYGHIMITTCM